MKVPGTTEPKQPTLPVGTTQLAINLADVSIAVGRTPDGRALITLGPLLTTINVFVKDSQTADALANALKQAGSGIVIPNVEIKL